MKDPRSDHREAGADRPRRREPTPRQGGSAREDARARPIQRKTELASGSPKARRSRDTNKIAILVLADTETHGDLGRAVNALEVAKEFKEAGDQVTIVFDGAGTRWIAELSNPEHKRHALFESLRNAIQGACAFCSAAFGVKDAVVAADIPLLTDFDQHPSIRSLVDEGYQVITF